MMDILNDVKGVENMSKKSVKPHKILGEQKTLPIQDRSQAAGGRGQERAASDANVKRAKKWQEEHGA